jgi:ankyrin repeat protein
MIKRAVASLSAIFFIAASSMESPPNLQALTERDALEQIRKLLAANPIIKSLEIESGGTLAHEVAARGDLAVMRCLIEVNAPLHWRDDNGRTPIMVAQERGHTHIVQELLSLPDHRFRFEEELAKLDILRRYEQRAWQSASYFSALSYYMKFRLINKFREEQNRAEVARKQEALRAQRKARVQALLDRRRLALAARPLPLRPSMRRSHALPDIHQIELMLASTSNGNPDDGCWYTADPTPQS